MSAPIPILFFASLLLFASQTHALIFESCFPLSEDELANSLEEHLYGSRPDVFSANRLYVRRGYVITYNEHLKNPIWAAWRADPEYRNTPKRVGRWKMYRIDPEAKTATSEDYKGWFKSPKNFARGHIVPYFISGGDRDRDGEDAEFEDTLKVSDKDDACTVFEINSMINISPQYHAKFNGRPGLWWNLERDVRHMIDDGHRFNVLAGTVFLSGVKVENIGNRNLAKNTWDIGVPHGFWKIVIDTSTDEAVGFLFDHSEDLPDGCELSKKSPSACIVDIAKIEQVTGLTFWGDFNEAKNSKLRNSSNKVTWEKWFFD